MAVNIVDVFVNDKYKQRTLSPQTNMYDTKNTCRAGMLKNGKEKGVVCHALHNGCGDSFGLRGSHKTNRISIKFYKENAEGKKIISKYQLMVNLIVIREN